MVTFNNEVLFEAGTTRFRIGPVRSRHALQATPGSIGVRLDAQGIEARLIKQSGEFIADAPLQLQGYIDAIIQKVDGVPHTLVDNHGRIWTDAVMTRIEAGEFVRVGARWKTSYQIEYLQVIP